MNDEDLLTREEVAKRLKVSPKMVGRLGIPKVRLADRTIRYRKEDIDAYLRSRLEYPSADPVPVRPARRSVALRNERGLPKVIGMKELLAIKGTAG